MQAARAGGRALFLQRNMTSPPEGNFEGHNILNRLKHLPRSMDDDGLTPSRPARLAMLRGKLLTGERNASGPASTTRCWPTGTA